MALWGQDKPALKRQGSTGEGWVRASLALAHRLGTGSPELTDLP